MKAVDTIKCQTDHIKAQTGRYTIYSTYIAGHQTERLIEYAILHVLFWYPYTSSRETLVRARRKQSQKTRHCGQSSFSESLRSLVQCMLGACVVRRLQVRGINCGTTNMVHGPLHAPMWPSAGSCRRLLASNNHIARRSPMHDCPHEA